ncbi:MAG TPA: EAL domain-containing protein [Frankiaceae bacterium]|nr:EAL domain-containing protein [Frankiaceae bacterium]
MLNSTPRDALAQASRSHLFRAIVENSGDLLMVVDGNGCLAYVSPSVRSVLGYASRDLIDVPLTSLLADSDATGMTDMLRAAAADPEQTCRAEATLRHSTGQWVPSEVTVTSLLHDPQVQGFVVTARDVGERKRLEYAMTRRALSDALTGLPNRVLFQARVEQALRQRSRPMTGVALLFCDLDGFKAVNDVQGHAAGDQLLKVVAARLLQCARPFDTVARLGGDEFAVLLTGPDVEEAAVEIAERIAASIPEPIALPDRSARVGTSIGLAVSTPGVTDADTLLRQADLAMYEAKRRATGHWMRFEPSMLAELAERAEIENDLRLASANRQLAVVYQPLRDIATGRFVGTEALLRWRHPQRGFVPPERFIRIAEQIGLIGQLGTWVLMEACRAGRRWQDAMVASAEADGTTPSVFHVSVNISARQLHEGLVDEVRHVLAETGLPAEALLLEVTETVLMERVDEAVALLRELKALGVRIAVDDFGTGYSSLSYLARFPVDFLKIDRSFIERLGKERDADELVRMIVGLGQALNLKIVAEGVETGGQLEALRAMRCDIAQGFLFMRPVPDWCIDELLHLPPGALERQHVHTAAAGAVQPVVPFQQRDPALARPSGVANTVANTTPVAGAS